MWIWYAIKERSLFYFSASNPSILTGGMMGESKFDVLSLIPDSVKPKTVLIALPASTQKVLQILEANGLTLPVIFKPDVGERGWMVRKIESKEDIEQYLSEIKIDFIAQEFVQLPLEYGVFYVRFPSQPNGFVNSITGKEFLSVTGDGTKTLKQLILEKDRAKIQWQTLKQVYQSRLNEIVPQGKKIELVSIGNHCLGTTFINCNHLITEKLSASFDAISRQIDGFYFGRFDLRCASEADLESGNVKIMELNGCGAEPAHIYHPGASLFTGIRTIITHWKNLYRVSKENHQRGVAYLSFKEGKRIYNSFKKMKSA
ncbi:MAG: D-alanine--D-alanine ligase [Bacteroidota bacterium]|nr:MAG: D-alanine--D-alanine ligase [Bacteroidota bacterium]